MVNAVSGESAVRPVRHVYSLQPQPYTLHPCTSAPLHPCTPAPRPYKMKNGLLTGWQAEALFDSYDKSGDGEIDKYEFRDALQVRPTPCTNQTC